MRLNKAQAERIAQIAAGTVAPDGVDLQWISAQGNSDGGLLVLGFKGGEVNWIEVVEAAPTGRLAWDLGR